MAEIEAYPQLKQRLWGGHLWNSSFYLETIGSISEEAIKKYIEKQKKGEAADVSNIQIPLVSEQGTTRENPLHSGTLSPSL